MGGKTYRAILCGRTYYGARPPKPVLGGTRKWDWSGLCPFPIWKNLWQCVDKWGRGGGTTYRSKPLFGEGFHGMLSFSWVFQTPVPLSKVQNPPQARIYRKGPKNPNPSPGTGPPPPREKKLKKIRKWAESDHFGVLFCSVLFLYFRAREGFCIFEVLLLRIPGFRGFCALYEPLESIAAWRRCYCSEQWRATSGQKSWQIETWDLMLYFPAQSLLFPLDVEGFLG